MDKAVGDITAADIMSILEKRPASPAKVRRWLRETREDADGIEEFPEPGLDGWRQKAMRPGGTAV